MFNKFLIVMVSIFTISTHLFCQNIYGNNFNEFTLSFNRNIEPRANVQTNIIDQTNVFITNETFSNIINANNGGAIYITNSSNINLTNVIFSGNSANTNGGAIYITNSSNINLTDVTFSNNNSSSYGGAMFIVSTSNIYLSNVTFTGNTAGRNGGALLIDRTSDIYLSNVTFTGNITSNNYNTGGAISFQSTTNVYLNNVTFNSNTTGRNGGAIYIFYSTNVSFNDATFTGNTAMHGGALFVHNTTDVSFSNTTFTGNTAILGGAMYIRDVTNFYLNNTTFSKNTASSNGGAIFTHNVTDLFFDNTTFTSNTAGTNGGVMFIESSRDIYLNNTTFTGNTAGSNGGAMFIDYASNISFSNTTFTSNTAIYGGAMYITSMNNINLNNVIFTGNTATTHGGAMFMRYGTNAHFNNVTFTGNTSSADSGALVIAQSSDLYFNNVAFTENIANERGGAIFFHTVSNINFTGTTFASNAATTDSGGAIYARNIDDVSFNNVAFTGNTSGKNGGAIFIDSGSSNVSFTDVTFTGNKANVHGGAMYIEDSTNFNFNNVTFTDNTSGSQGGAIRFNKVSNINFNNATFSGNTTDTYGGGLFFNQAEDITLTDVTFINNTATVTNGGGILIARVDNFTLTDANFIDNSAGGNGGGMYIYDATDINLNVTSGNTSTFSNNTDKDGGNSIYFDGTTDTVFDVDTANDGTLNMFDGIESSSTLTSLKINKTGGGTWNLHGSSVFDSANTAINISAGTFNMGDNTQIKLNGANSSFTVAEGVNFDFVIKDGTPIIVGDGTTTTVDINTTKQISIAVGSYVGAGSTETFTIIENVSDIKLANVNLEYDDSHILLYAENATLIPGTTRATTYTSATVDVGRHQAEDVMTNLNSELISTVNQYMGGNHVLETILTSGNATQAEQELTTLSHIAKASGSLHAHDVIGSAINQQIFYGLKNRQGTINNSAGISPIPISFGITPLFLFSETFDNEDNMKLGSELNSYGGLIYIEVEIPTPVVSSDIGVIGGAGYSQMKATGDYSDVGNDSIYYTGGLYYNVAYEKMRSTLSVFYLGMKNEVIKSFGNTYKTDFLTHGLNVGLDFAYDFNFVKELFFSPFITLNYSYYYHPKLDTKFGDNVVFETSEGSKNTFYIPVGFTLSYDFLVKEIHTITPSIRLNGNIPVYDSGLKTSWLLDDITTGEKIDNSIIQNHDIGIFDANFNFSYKMKMLTVYADYTFELYENANMSHFVGTGVKISL